MIGIILASGFSRRMGENKLLLEIEGEKIIEKVIKACKKSDLESIILIYREERVRNIGDKYNLKTIYNPKANLGQSEAMKLGIRNSGNSEDYMFFVGDQPFLSYELINLLIEEYKKSKSSILIPYYNENRGMPMIISSKYKNELLNVVGDKGARDIVNKYIKEVTKVYIKEEKQGIDIDTPEDLNLNQLL
jgi:molybdenum cofactor cytidylyltransferase